MANRSSFWLWALVVGCLLLAGFAIDKSCVAGRELAAAKADYAERVRVLEADNAIKQGAILKAEEVITQQNLAIAQANADKAEKDRQILALKATLHDLQDAEPPTTPEVEALPIVINLRAQVSRLTAMFTLSEAKNGDKDRVIVSLQTIVAAKDDVIAAWRGQYENEHTLRVAAEGLFKKSEHARKSNSLVKKVALGVAAGAVIYAATK